MGGEHHRSRFGRLWLGIGSNAGLNQLLFITSYARHAMMLFWFGLGSFKDGTHREGSHDLGMYNVVEEKKKKN